MRKLLKSFALVAIAALGAVSCTENMVDDTIIPNTGGVTLYATTPSDDRSTRVEFEDKGGEGISLSWEAGDTFTLYDGEVEIDIFTTIGDGLFTSSNTNLTLENGVTYTAKYNEGASLTSQDGDKINNLDNACQMEASFTYGTDKSIAFAHKMAIMTFKFESDERPAYLIFENGEESYTVNYKELDPVDNIYTSHIMISPCEGTARTLTFSLYNSEGVAYDIRRVDSQKAYAIGFRYTASTSPLENSVWSGAGTEDNPYQIENAAQLRQLSTAVSSGLTYSGEFFELMCDIDLGGIDAEGTITAANEFTRIGSSTNIYFGGSFDGAGHTVSGLYINSGGTIYNQALFGYICDATIKNLSVSGRVTAYRYVGGIVGNALRSSIINCHNMVEIVANMDSGGVVGYASENSLVINCYNSAKISISQFRAGGVVGSANQTYIHSCYNVGEVSGNTDGTGGIIGCSYGSTFVNCYNAAKLSGAIYVGGIVGKAISYNWTIYSVGYDCYHDHDLFDGDAVGYRDIDRSTISDMFSYSTTVMKSAYFVDMLNNKSYLYNQSKPTVEMPAWGVASGAYPTFDTEGTPTETDFSTISSCTAYGSGTSSAPYIIFNGAQLRDLASDVNGGSLYSDEHFEMACDIDLGGIDTEGEGVAESEFTAIGTSSSTCFKGTFNGGGYQVSGLYINKSGVKYQGLFGYIYYATVENLGVSGSVTGGSSTAGVVAYIFNSSLVNNCHFSGSVVGSSSRVGGVVGYTQSPVINCYNKGMIKGAGSSTGGVVGYATTGSVSNCYNVGTVFGTGIAGGVVGYTSQSLTTVSNCYNAGSVSGDGITGGVVGRTSSSITTIVSCFNRGAVSTTTEYVAGIVGYNEGKVSNCYSTGSVSGTRYVGGVIGQNISSGSMSDSTHDSTVYSGKAMGSNSSSSENNSGSATLKADMTNGTFAAILGSDAWQEDYTTQINSGYPILIWQ